MFSRWGAFVYRFRRPVAVGALVLAGLASIFAGRATGELSFGGWLDPTSESATVSERLASQFGGGKGTLIAVFRSEAGDARSEAFQADVAGALAGLQDDEHVTGVVGYAETQQDRFISTDGRSAFSVIQLRDSDEEALPYLDELREKIVAPAGITIQLTGIAPATQESAEQAEKELIQAETVSLPFAALILILVFGSLLAAGLPLLVAGLAIPTTLAAIYVVALNVEMSIYSQTVATMLGLALAIDYSLFMVSRFREELRRGRSVGDAVAITVATSGKAVMFSGLAVAIGLAGLLLFEAPALRSFGIAGSLVVAASLLYALTFLPAMLGMLGPRVNSLSIRGLIRRFRPADDVAPTDASRWERIARAVMARPIAVLVPVLLLLLAAGTPFLHLQQGVPDASILPRGLESREASVALQDDFQPGETSPIQVLVDVEGSPFGADNVRTLVRYGAALAGVDGIERVESPFSGLVNPQTGAALTEDEYVAFLAAPQLPPQFNALLETFVDGSTVRFDAISPASPTGPDAIRIIPRVRALGDDFPIATEVGGTAAIAADFMTAQSDRIPWAVGVTMAVIAIVLFLLFGSIAIPIKAVFMTLLSITASFGALVWIFQDGNLANILGFESPGYTVAGNPIIMFSVIFGLSMDYEVLLLSRIQEAYRRTGDNRASVAEGLAKTAGVITGAALVMIVVFSAFALAESISIKSIGVGMAIAVAIDATIIRILLVPATMRLLGRWNWWAPGVLARFADRLGFSHVEDEPEPAPDAPASTALAGG